MTNAPRVTVWNEHQHEKNNPEVGKYLPKWYS
jgi:trehalose utilization protein